MSASALVLLALAGTHAQQLAAQLTVQAGGEVRVSSGAVLNIGVGAAAPGSVSASDSSPMPSGPPPPTPSTRLYAFVPFGGATHTFYNDDVTSSANNWTTGPSIEFVHTNPAVAVIPGTNHIFVTGTTGWAGTTVSRFDISTNQWAEPGTVADYSPAYRYQAMVSLPISSTCCVYMVGGWQQNWVVLRTVQQYDDDGSNTWTSAPNLNEKRASAAATVFQGKIWVCGGMFASASTSKRTSCESWDGLAPTWTLESAQMAEGHAGSALIASGGIIYNLGGYGVTSGRQANNGACTLGAGIKRVVTVRTRAPCAAAAPPCPCPCPGLRRQAGVGWPSRAERLSASPHPYGTPPRSRHRLLRDGCHRDI